MRRYSGYAGRPPVLLGEAPWPFGASLLGAMGLGFGAVLGGLFALSVVSMAGHLALWRVGS